jgi:hypothetical protein
MLEYRQFLFNNHTYYIMKKGGAERDDRGRRAKRKIIPARVREQVYDAVPDRSHCTMLRVRGKSLTRKLARVNLVGGANGLEARKELPFFISKSQFQTS